VALPQINNYRLSFQKCFIYNFEFIVW
jgi:hypothetical protein